MQNNLAKSLGPLITFMSEYCCGTNDIHRVSSRDRNKSMPTVRKDKNVKRLGMSFVQALFIAIVQVRLSQMFDLTIDFKVNTCMLKSLVTHSCSPRHPGSVAPAPNFYSVQSVYNL